jgi:hypothetical protein
MIEQPMRERILDLCRDASRYRYRAYMSSALTNLPPGSERLIPQLEKLYVNVCDKAGVFLYLPHLWSNPNDPGEHSQVMTPADVHILDRLRIAESDFMILCADYPSFGVGQEFEIAQAMGLPIIIFHATGRKVSRMLLGGAAIYAEEGQDADLHTAVITYDDDSDLEVKLAARIHELMSRLSPATHDSTTFDGLGAVLEHFVAVKGVAGLAQATGLSVPVIQHLMSNRASIKRVLTKYELPEFKSPDLTKYVNPGLWVLTKIARALSVSWDELLGFIPTMSSDREPEEHIAQVRRRAFLHVLEREDPKAYRFWQRLHRKDDAEIRIAARDEKRAIKHAEKLWDQEA